MPCSTVSGSRWSRYEIIVYKKMGIGRVPKGFHLIVNSLPSRCELETDILLYKLCNPIFVCFFLSGCVGIVDYDTVEMSNLHRQVLHTENRVNISKAESVKIQLNQ